VLDHSCQVQRHPLAERGDDLYETPPVAVEALLRVDRIPRRVWEPACGHGAIARINGELREIFITNHRAGSGAGIMASDAAVVTSIALQYGVPVGVIRKALMRDAQGRASGPLDVALDLIAQVES